MIAGGIFEYRTYNHLDKLEPYSGGFKTEIEAKTWYIKHGVWLEKHFKRTLVLVRNTKQLNLNL